MKEILLLPEPKPKKRQKWYLFPLFSACFLIIVALLSSLFRQPEILANITFESFESQMIAQRESMLDALIEGKNQQLIDVRVDGEVAMTVPLQSLGLHFDWPDESFEYKDFPVVSAFFEPLDDGLKGAAPDDTESHLNAELSIERGQWEGFVSTLKERFERQPQPPSVEWDNQEGWTYLRAVQGTKLSEQSIDQSFVRLVSHLSDHHAGLALELETQPVRAKMSARERHRIQQLREQLDTMMAEGLRIRIGEDSINLDLKRERTLITLEDEGFVVDQMALHSYLEALAERSYREAQEVRIVGHEKNSRGVLKAVTEGSFEEGQRINVDEAMRQVMEAIDAQESEVSIRLYEIPVKVYSELEERPYQLLSVGYSEYSKGNAANRVHNIKTGLERINKSLYLPGDEISFNRSNGPINGEFRTGYAIMGNSAKPSLGGGICQVSTTFYRALLNGGLPILQRQNHSWDLSYYQAGGYGLDATIFPSVGLDVRAKNDFEHGLFIYSYTRPDTEEAFVLIYGVDDGRQVTLEPKEEYIPWKGAKTLEWTRKVEYPDGTLQEHQIVSRYRS